MISYMLRMIGDAIRPAKNVRVHFTKEVFDHSLTSQTPSEVDKELLLPVFEYEFSLCESGWMCLETMKGGCFRKHEEEREIRKTFHTYGFNMSLQKRRQYLRIATAKWLHLYEFWAEFMGYDLNNYDYPGRWYRLSVSGSDGFYSVNRGDVRYLTEGREGSRVVRAQYLFPDGRVNFESIHDIKQFPNGVWFQMGYDMMRYGDAESGREARFHRCVRVTDVEFDAKTFEVPEGVDAITRAT